NPMQATVKLLQAVQQLSTTDIQRNHGVPSLTKHGKFGIISGSSALMHINPARKPNMGVETYSNIVICFAQIQRIPQ
ncbi:MAG: hypothetical protein VX083_06125, partial [Pseudomonadota bacterium]|nr:hypothetical protein [Pseudomonadota bacterium]